MSFGKFVVGKYGLGKFVYRQIWCRKIFFGKFGVGKSPRPVHNIIMKIQIFISVKKSVCTAFIHIFNTYVGLFGPFLVNDLRTPPLKKSRVDLMILKGADPNLNFFF